MKKKKEADIIFLTKFEYHRRRGIFFFNTKHKTSKFNQNLLS